MPTCKTSNKDTTIAYIKARIIIEPQRGCWLWTKSLTKGYARSTITGPMKYVHRVSYETFVGPIDEGLEIDHLCRVTHCVNPAHLEPVTHTENARRGRSAAKFHGKSHCPHGHKYTDANVYVWKDRQGRKHRMCRTCISKRVRK